MMANAVTTGCLLSLMLLYFLSNSVVGSAAARGGSQGDSWTRRQRRFTGTLAHHQRLLLAGDEGGREADYDVLLRRKRDSLVNGGTDDERGVDAAKWVDSSRSIDDLNKSEFLRREAAAAGDDDALLSPRSSGKDGEAPAKRKWSENNVRIWGKRKWSSKGLHMWGKRQEDAAPAGFGVQRSIGSEGGQENRVREDWPRWEEGQQGQLYGLKKEGEETKKKRQRWAKNNLKMWGKRYDGEGLNAGDLEDARVRALGSRAAEGEHSEEHSDGLQDSTPYGNSISGHLQKRNNPPYNGVEQKWGKKGWANNNVRIWG